MPDPIRTVDQTQAADAGHTTTEFKLAVVAFCVGACLEGSVIPILNKMAELHPASTWIAAVVALLGVLLQVCSLFGYTSSRTQVKSALALAGKPSQAVVTGTVLEKVEAVLNPQLQEKVYQGP